MLFGSISHWKRQLSEGALTPAELVESLGTAMEKENPALNAYLSWNTEAALQQAAQADLAKPLGGIPIAVKDNICIAGAPTRCASRMLENFVSPYDATAVEKLRAAGAILFGRTNMDEFAMGSAGENSAFGPTRNPADTERVPGGSSSGSVPTRVGQPMIRVTDMTVGGRK